MNFGFNSNVPIGNTTYHVQTEDRGPSHMFLDTVVYLAGRVVYKRSTGYEQLVQSAKAETLSGKLHELLAKQHRAVIADLEAGTLPLHTTVKEVYAEKKEASRDGLDLRLLNPKGCFAAGKVLLEIALFDKHTKKLVGEADIQAFLEKKKQRVPCAQARTDAKGRATLQFPFPSNAGEGSSLVICATHGARNGELRFRLKAKSHEKTPVSTLR